MRIDELFNRAALETAISDGYVRRQEHPAEPLAILNYAEKAAYENAWNPITLACRGLIYHKVTGELVARPWRKFFNWGQAGCAAMNLDHETVVTDKMDGSLGILYRLPSGGWAIATRGSFASEQAIHATDVYQSRYVDRFQPEPGVTYLFEIIYPENRVVLDYGDLDDLVLLGAVDIGSGKDVSDVVWPGSRAAEFGYVTLGEALEASPRPNAEGLVCYFPANGERVKLKQADYVALHRIVTGLTARTVWEHMLTGAPLSELIEPLPDEFHDWVRGIAGGITDSVAAEVERIGGEYRAVLAQMADGWTPADRAGRKDFAMVAAVHPDKWALFRLLDGGDIAPELLKRARPGPYLTPSGRTYTEDTA